MYVLEFLISHFSLQKCIHFQPHGDLEEEELGELFAWRIRKCPLPGILTFNNLEKSPLHYLFPANYGLGPVAKKIRLVFSEMRNSSFC